MRTSLTQNMYMHVYSVTHQHTDTHTQRERERQKKLSHQCVDTCTYPADHLTEKFISHQHMLTPTPHVQKKVGHQHVSAANHLTKNKKKSFCYAPMHVDTHTLHRRKKKLDVDMFDVDPPNIKKLSCANTCWCAHLTQTKEKEKVERRHQTCRTSST